MEHDADIEQAYDIAKHNDLDAFANFISDDIREEVKRLYAEQTMFRQEIAQLREERSLLFELLQQRHEPQTSELSFVSDSFTIEGGSRDVNSREEPIQPKADATFSKEVLLREMKNYDNDTFERAAAAISHARSGDAIIKYFTNACGSKIRAMDQEINVLKREIASAHRRRRMAVTTAKTEELKRKCESIGHTSLGDSLSSGDVAGFPIDVRSESRRFLLRNYY